MKRFISALLAGILLSTSAFPAGWSPGGPFTSFNTLQWFSTQPVIPAPVNTVLPVISGTTQVGQVLSTTNGTWTGAVGFNYQWLSAGNPIFGANSNTYTLTSAEVGLNMTVRVGGFNSSGSVGATSAARGPVTAVAGAPGISSLPVITGTPQVGSLLTSSNGVWTGSPTSFTYQWLGAGTPISGATSSTYTPVSGDTGNFLSDTVTAHNGAGAGSATATAVGPVTTSGGSPGFLAATTGTIAVQNIVKGSNDFVPADAFWTTAISGTGTTPVVTPVSDTLPDGTTGTVSSATFPAFAAGSTNLSVINQTTASTINAKTVTFGLWAKILPGGSPQFISVTQGTTFFRATVPADNAWHQVNAQVLPGTFTNLSQPQLQIGINQFDASQRTATLATTMELTGAYVVDGKASSLLTFNDVNTTLATTSAIVTADLTKPLFAHTAFRDPSVLVPSVGNPILSELSTEVWRSGGVSNPYVQSQFQSGGLYWAFSNCTSSANHAAWTAFCLWSSPDGVNSWTEDTLNAPYVQTFGSTMGATGSAAFGTGSGAQRFQLKPAFLPFGGFANGAAHNFCILYSAIKSGGGSGVYEACSDTVDGVYTPLGCPAGAGACTGQTQVAFVVTPLSYGQNNLVSILNVGGINGTNYIYTSNGGSSQGLYTVIWTTPANPATTTAGNTLTYDTLALPPLISGDWEFADGATQLGDSYVFLNHCGFYEYFYTAVNLNGTTAPFTTKKQLVGEAISNTPEGPWLKPTGPLIPATSSMYFGAPYIGDSAVMELGGNFVWTGNFDDGTSTSRMVSAVAPQGVCP